VTAGENQVIIFEEKCAKGADEETNTGSKVKTRSSNELLVICCVLCIMYKI